MDATAAFLAYNLAAVATHDLAVLVRCVHGGEEERVAHKNVHYMHCFVSASLLSNQETGLIARLLGNKTFFKSAGSI